jgi:hypothetical protein
MSKAKGSDDSRAKLEKLEVEEPVLFQKFVAAVVAASKDVTFSPEQYAILVRMGIFVEKDGPFIDIIARADTLFGLGDGGFFLTPTPPR